MPDTNHSGNVIKDQQTPHSPLLSDSVPLQRYTSTLSFYRHKTVIVGWKVAFLPIWIWSQRFHWIWIFVYRRVFKQYTDTEFKKWPLLRNLTPLQYTNKLLFKLSNNSLETLYRQLAVELLNWITTANKRSCLRNTVCHNFDWHL